jgi:5-methylcytosine-specific restriction endonuclease McrA
MTERQKAYSEFLKTDFWKNLRDQAVERDKQCRHCGNTSKPLFEVHHMIYRTSWYDTRLDDLQTLCKPCHRSTHGLVKKVYDHSEARKRKQRKKAFKNRMKKRHGAAWRSAQAFRRRHWSF